MKPYSIPVAQWLRYRQACHEFDPSTTEDPPCKGAMFFKSVKSSNVSRWCGVVVRRRECQIRCRSRHLTMVRNDEVRRQKPSCI
ncbi:hypothetical protein TNCV_1437931 [Trichonephila clavipes]|nr:hypothetical protein TNCV_1437931 [Trichonephila clavipes]